MCGRDELLFYLLRPDNLSILSLKGIRGRGLMGFSRDGILELLALDSRESFEKCQYYQRRLRGTVSSPCGAAPGRIWSTWTHGQSPPVRLPGVRPGLPVDSKAAEDRAAPGDWSS